MNFFLHKLINRKKYLIIMFSTILIVGFLFGLFEYQYCSNHIITFFQTLFFIDKKQTEYPLYLLQNILYIFFNTYLSSSYLGVLGISFLLFLKGIQIAFSFIYIFSFNLIPIQILLVSVQFIFEIILLLILFFPNIILSIQTLIVTFIMKDNFNYKSIINYNLNSVILVLIVFIISLFTRIYLIDLI